MSELSREARLVRDFIVPPVIALIIGGFGAFVGVKVAVAEQAVAIASVSVSLKELKDTVQTLNKDLQGHKTEDGHSTMVERVKGLERRMTIVEAK